LLFEEEGIDLNKINYIDNRDCISTLALNFLFLRMIFFSLDLFEDQITGWFHLLDEESKSTERQSNHSKINVSMNFIFNLFIYGFLFVSI
jgi:hypothetical protein